MEVNILVKPMNSEEIISVLPYQTPFLFVDELSTITEDGITGSYTYNVNEYFYKGHFKEHPITPGVILTETMAQIGVVCLGIYLSRNKEKLNRNPQVALTSSAVDFYVPVYPGERVTVISEKEYFRFNKLKCKVQLFNAQDQLVCRGFISGMINEK